MSRPTCYLVTVPIGGGCAWSLTLCGRSWRERPRTTDAHAVTCPDCIWRELGIAREIDGYEQQSTHQEK